MDTAGSETALDNLEATSFPEHKVASRHPNVVERDMTMPMRRVIETVDAHHAVDGDALRIRGHKNNRLLPVRVFVVWVRLGHDDVDLTSWVSSTAGPPFLWAQSIPD